MDISFDVFENAMIPFIPQHLNATKLH